MSGDSSSAPITPHARAKRAAVDAARDGLFVDADRHGPRWPVLAARIAPVLVLVPLAIAVASWSAWRSLIVHAVTDQAADGVLVAPVLVAIVLLAWAMAPLARVPAEPMLGCGLVLLGASVWAVTAGQVVLATLPGTIAALLIGLVAARIIRRIVWMLPVLLAAGVSDAHSVQSGVTHELLEGSTSGAGQATVDATWSIPDHVVARVDLLVLHIPAATGTWMLGLVDVVAVGMLFGLAHLYWLRLDHTAAALATALVLTVVVGTAMPVLPILGIAWLLVHARLVWQATRFSLRRLIYLGG